MALRSTYNTGVHGSGFFGIQETTQGAVSASWSVSASASAVTVVRAASTAAISSSATASGEIVKDGAVSANVLSVVTSSAIEYVRNDGFRDGYGKNTYGSFVYGENYSVEDGAATATVSVSATATPQVIRNVASTTTCELSVAVIGYLAQVGAATTTVSITPNIAYNRIRNCAASDSILGETTVVSRYKWLSSTDPTTTWTTADYLERAA